MVERSMRRRARAERLARGGPGALALALALAAVASAAPGAERIATFDPAGSRVAFVLQATGHEVRGTFAVSSATVRWDPETGIAAGDIVVDAASGATGNARRDRKMHAEVLETDSFPRFSFRVERLAGRVVAPGRSTVRLSGRLRLHGGEHPLTVDAEIEVRGDRIDAVASFEVPYVEWGLRDPSVFVLRVAKAVTVTVELAGTLRTAAP